MKQIEEILEKTLKKCKKIASSEVVFQKKSNFNIKYKNYLNIFLSQEEISNLFASCKTFFELENLYLLLTKFLLKNGASFTRKDNGVLLVLHWQYIDVDLLLPFCKKCNASYAHIQMHLFSEIRKSIEYNLNNPEFDLVKTKNITKKFIKLLVYCNINPKRYFGDWFKRTQVYEGDVILHSPIAHENIRVLKESLKSK